MNPSKNLVKTVAGAVVAAVSTAMIADYAMRRAKEKTAYTALLLAGIAGLAAGTALAGLAVREARRERTSMSFQDELDDCEVAEIEESMNEIFCDSAE